jgi:hypothetical protein
VAGLCHAERMSKRIPVALLIAVSAVMVATNAASGDHNGQPVLGVLNSAQGLPHPWVGTNRWEGERRGQLIVVLAAGRATSVRPDGSAISTRGAVVDERFAWTTGCVTGKAGCGTRESSRTMLAPEGVLSLRVRSGRFPTLILVSPSGRVVAYDLRTHELIRR